MINIQDRLIQIAEEKYGKDSKVAERFRKNKKISELKKGKSFREIYAERQTFTVGHKNKKVNKSLI